MEIKGLSMFDQLKMIKGVEGILPKKSEITPDEKTAEPGGKKVSFAEFLANQMQEVNQSGLDAEKAIQRSVSGQETNPHETLIAVQKADISLSLMMSIKERIERAYQDIIKTPL